METILNVYYGNNAQKLHSMVDTILLKLGFAGVVDHEDFYSLANEIFTDVLGSYDKSKPFDRYLYSCLSNQFKTEMTKRNRQKRQVDRMAVSIDMPICDGEDTTLGDIIPDQFNLEEEILEEGEDKYSKRMQLYLGKLSALQKEVLSLTAEGYLPSEIRQKLRISEKQFSDCNAAIHSYRNVAVLF